MAESRSGEMSSYTVNVAVAASKLINLSKRRFRFKKSMIIRRMSIKLKFKVSPVSNGELLPHLDVSFGPEAEGGGNLKRGKK